MALGKFFKSIFGGSSNSPEPAAIETIEYNGFTIEASPLPEGSQFRTAGFISGELDGEVKRIQYIRVDQHGSLQDAIDYSVTKAKQIIDERGVELLKQQML